MPDEQPEAATQQLTTEIVSAYVQRNQLAADRLPSLISTIHAALASLSVPAEPIAAALRTPAVPIRRSVTANLVICLDCGWKGKMLKRHLTTAHGLTAAEYLGRWNLPRDHALTAPAYSEHRSTVAKQLGLGRRGRTLAPYMAPPEAAATETTPKRRGRPRSTAT